MSGDGEPVYFEDTEVCICSGGVISCGKKVSLDSVQCVEEIIEEPAKIGLPTVTFFVGFVATMETLTHGEPAAAFLLLVGTMLSGAWIAACGAWYLVTLVRPEGRNVVVATRNKQFAREVATAILKALDERREPEIGHE